MMEATVTKIQEKIDDCGSGVEITLRINYDNYHSAVPEIKNYALPYMLDDNCNVIPQWKNDYNEAIQKFLVRYAEWETAEMNRRKKNYEIDSLRVGSISLVQDPLIEPLLPTKSPEVVKLLEGTILK